MQVTRWGDSLAVRLPAAVVEALSLKEGDDIEICIAGDRTFIVDQDQRRVAALEGIRILRCSLPPRWSFGRQEANERR